jgi:hypothetical protein
MSASGAAASARTFNTALWRYGPTLMHVREKIDGYYGEAAHIVVPYKLTGAQVLMRRDPDSDGNTIADLEVGLY